MGVRYSPPQSAQEKFEAVRDALRILRRRLENRRDRAAWQETASLKYEHDGLLDLVSFNFPDPERKREVDLDFGR